MNIRDSIHFKIGEVQGFLFLLNHNNLLSERDRKEAMRLRDELTRISEFLSENGAPSQMPAIDSEAQHA